MSVYRPRLLNSYLLYRDFCPSLQVLVVDFRSELMGVAVDACEIGLEHAV